MTYKNRPPNEEKYTDAEKKKIHNLNPGSLLATDNYKEVVLV